jgi:hypothetical protein
MLTTGILRSESASHVVSARWSEQPEQPTAILRTFICPLVVVAEQWFISDDGRSVSASGQNAKNSG